VSASEFAFDIIDRVRAGHDDHAVIIAGAFFVARLRGIDRDAADVCADVNTEITPERAEELSGEHGRREQVLAYAGIAPGVEVDVDEPGCARVDDRAIEGACLSRAGKKRANLRAATCGEARRSEKASQTGHGKPYAVRRGLLRVREEGAVKLPDEWR
jgi:hypothetical protein